MRKTALSLFFLACLGLPAEDWGPLQFLAGEWVGEGGGQPGETSAGSFSFAPDLQGTILVRKSFAQYPAANGRPASRHDDLTVIYRDAVSKQLRATYWDNEGHVIQYRVEPVQGGAVLASDEYRLTYTAAGKDQVKIKFEVAQPGKGFVTYLEARARRK